MTSFSVPGEGRCYSAYAHLLPYFNASQIYDAVNFSLSPEQGATLPGVPENTTVLNVPISTLLCPTDTNAIKLQGDSGVHNYPLCTGTVFPLSPRNPWGIRVDGVFYENSSTRLKDIADGASKTVCISETVIAEGGPSVWDGVSPTNGFVLVRGNTNAPPNGPGLTDYDGQCTGAGLALQQTRGSRWLYGTPGHSMYNHHRPPNDSLVDCRGGLPHSNRADPYWAELSLSVSAHSRHAGGIHVLCCDGSVHFVDDRLGLDVWKALATRNGAETATSNPF